MLRRVHALLTPANCGLATFLVVLGVGVVVLNRVHRRGREPLAGPSALQASLGVEIPSFTLTRSLRPNGAPGPRADMFAPQDGRVYLWYAYRNAAAGEVLGCEWYRAGELLPEATGESRLQAAAGSGAFAFPLSPDTPSGIYGVSLRNRGRELISAGFAVVQGLSSLRITDVTLAPDIGPDGRPLQGAWASQGEVVRVPPTFPQICVAFRFANATPGDLIECRWMRDGESAALASAATRFTGVGGWGAFTLRNKRGLPEGRYAAELLHHGRIVGRASFDVSAAAPTTPA